MLCARASPPTTILARHPTAPGEPCSRPGDPGADRHDQLRRDRPQGQRRVLPAHPGLQRPAPVGDQGGHLLHRHPPGLSCVDEADRQDHGPPAKPIRRETPVSGRDEHVPVCRTNTAAAEPRHRRRDRLRVGQRSRAQQHHSRAALEAPGKQHGRHDRPGNNHHPLDAGRHQRTSATASMVLPTDGASRPSRSSSALRASGTSPHPSRFFTTARASSAVIVRLRRPRPPYGG